MALEESDAPSLGGRATCSPASPLPLSDLPADRFRRSFQSRSYYKRKMASSASHLKIFKKKGVRSPRFVECPVHGSPAKDEQCARADFSRLI